MKYLKMLGLAAVAAMALMAFAGAGTASATTLCTKTNEAGTACEAGFTYKAGTTLLATLKAGTSAKLTSPRGTVVATCTESTVHAIQENETETWIKGELTEKNLGLSWGGCKQITNTLVSGTLDIMWTKEDEGIVRATNSEVTVNVFGVSCVYGAGAGTELGTIKGGEAPLLNINEAPVAFVSGSFACPREAFWDAEYTVTEPHAVHIVN